MGNLDKFEDENEEDICIACTDRICEKDEGCSYQTDLDKMQGIFSYRNRPAEYAIREEERAIHGLPPLEHKTETTPAPSTNLPLEPPVDDPQPVQQTSPSPQIKKPGRPSKVEVIPPPPKRKPGGQPGNLNAIKHGLYVDGNVIHSTNPIERVMLFDLNSAINQFKDYFSYTYENGLKQKSMAEINETMHNLSLAAVALTRLIETHNEHDKACLPFERGSRMNKSLEKIIDYYAGKVDSFNGCQNQTNQIPPEEE